MTRYLSCAETAKLVRAALKAEFPGQKFSVRSSTYAGGASIDVSWTDGPTTKEVEGITNAYEGKSFDGSIDMACHWQHWMLPDGTVTVAQGTGTTGSMGFIPSIKTDRPEGAELVSMGADYVQPSRSFSAEFLRPIAERVAKREGFPSYEIKTHDNGSAWVHCETNAKHHSARDLATFVWREAEKISQNPAVTPPETKPEAETPSTRAMETPPARATLTEYKGHPLIALDTGNGRPFTFGLSKAMAILANLDAVAKFVQTDGASI